MLRIDSREVGTRIHSRAGNGLSRRQANRGTTNDSGCGNSGMKSMVFRPREKHASQQTLKAPIGHWEIF
jgi:hypothetical protein